MNIKITLETTIYDGIQIVLRIKYRYTNKGAPYLSQCYYFWGDATWWRKHLYGFYFYVVVHQKKKCQSRKSSRARTEPGKSCWYHCHQGWFFLALVFMASLPCFSIETNFSSPRMEPPTVGWGWAIPHKLLMKKTPYRFAYSPILWRHFPNWISSSKTKLSSTSSKH